MCNVSPTFTSEGLYNAINTMHIEFIHGFNIFFTESVIVSIANTNDVHLIFLTFNKLFRLFSHFHFSVGLVTHTLRLQGPFNN